MIVNAANQRMLGGGGVDGAIHSAAGPTLYEACSKIPEINGVRCPFGEARITPAGNLPCKFVIHTVGPIYQQADNPPAVLARAYENSIQLARDHNCTSMAFPAISCGIYGYPAQEAAGIALRICNQTVFSEMEFYFYLFSQEMLAIWQAVADSMDC